MPYKANEARRHKIPRARYKVTNWPEYDRALQHRGSLTVWVTPEALAAWHPPRTGRRGRSRAYSDLAIETGHLLRRACGRPWRQTEGLLRSLAAARGNRHVPLQGDHRSGPSRPDSARPEDRSQGCLLGAQPDDPARHAGVAAHLLKATIAANPRPSADLCTNAVPRGI